MFLSAWSLALSLLSLVALILTAIATRTAVKVLRWWDPASDSNRQIRLENETWLSSTLVQYGMGFQILSLLLFVLAADHFSQVISGAMCATGALTANAYGMPTLLLKILGAFFYGFWIVLHGFDIRSEQYPLLKAKYIALVCLLPLLAVDVVSQTLYLANLEPDIITSCCAVVFGEGGGDSGNLLGAVPQGTLSMLFYGIALVLVFCGSFLFRCLHPLLLWLNGLVWLLFVGVALVAITTIFSSYIYAMPYHHCPFCILKPEYGYIGKVAEAGSPMIASLNRAGEEVARTAQTLQVLAGEETPTVQHLNTALQEISRAARALRFLAETLEEQPEAIMQGKRFEEGRQ